MPELLLIGPALFEGGGTSVEPALPTPRLSIIADVLTTWQRSRVQTTLGSVVESFHLTR